MEETNNHRKNSGDIQIPIKHLYLVLVGIGFLALLLIILKTEIFTFGNSISQNDAQEKLLDFFSTQVQGSTISVESISKIDGFYIFNVTLDGEDTILYMTLDGKYIAIGVMLI